MGAVLSVLYAARNGLMDDEVSMCTVVPHLNDTTTPCEGVRRIREYSGRGNNYGWILPGLRCALSSRAR